MPVVESKGRERFAMTCKFVKKFLLAMLAIHKHHHTGTGDQVTSDAEPEANYALYSEEIAENEANEALLTSLSHGAAMKVAKGCRYEYPVQCVETYDGSFYWDDSMQRLPVAEDFIEVHVNSFRNVLACEQWQ